MLQRNRRSGIYLATAVWLAWAYACKSTGHQTIEGPQSASATASGTGSGTLKSLGSGLGSGTSSGDETPTGSDTSPPVRRIP